MNYIKRITIVLITLKYIMINRFIKNNDSSNELVVLSSSAIGDNLVFVDPFNKIEEMFKSQNKALTIVCDNKMECFWKNNKRFADTKVVPINVTAIKKCDVEQFKTIIKKLRNVKYDHVILPMHHSISVMVSACMKATCYDAVMYDEWIINRHRFIKIVYKNIFSNVIHASSEQFLGKSYEELLWSIFKCEYSWKIAKIKMDIDRNDMMKGMDYIIVAPYSNLSERSLSFEQTVKIVNYLIKNTNSFIVISATGEYHESVNNMVKHINNCRIVNLCGKTSFHEYLNLIKNCKFVIGTDSGSIHVAAAFNKKAIALCGLWSRIFLPYDTKNKEECNPIVIRIKNNLLCKNCLSYKKGIYGKNKDCYHKISRDGIRCCLEMINVDEVYSSIDKMIQLGE